MKRFLILLVAPMLILACRTNSDPATELATGAAGAIPEYDGSADTMDALPDCNQDMVGSNFWVRTVKTAFECAADGQWAARGHLDPDENSPDDNR